MAGRQGAALDSIAPSMLAAVAKTGFVTEGCNKNFGYLQKLWQGIVSPRCSVAICSKLLVDCYMVSSDSHNILKLFIWSEKTCVSDCL